MADKQASYACDQCRLRKVSCTRTKPKCDRCKTEGKDCGYSRSGVIRRNRTRKQQTRDTQSPLGTSQPTTHPPSNGTVNDSGNLPGSAKLITHAGITFDSLQSHHKPVDAIGSLSEVNSAMWFDEADLEKNGFDFFLFREEANAWVDLFSASLEGEPTSALHAPPDVLDHLRSCQPYRIRDRAWVLLYYTTVLGHVSATDPDNRSLKRKLRRNIWLSLHDARLLLEPSELNIQALTVLACRSKDFATPSLCWMLATTACRMLQAISINDKRLDSEARERRVMLFWQLNLLDKSLSVIFGRPPTFHRSMARRVGTPTLQQLMAHSSQQASDERPKIFKVHFFYQRLLLSNIMSDVWNCLYEDEKPNVGHVYTVLKDVREWYTTAREVLEAAATTERPFLGASGGRALDIGLHCLDFLYHYFRVLLSRVAPNTRPVCIESSKALLLSLQHIGADSESQFPLSLWQFLCCPFTPFLELFAEIVSNNQGSSAENRDALAAMERLSTFLRIMGQRNSLAAKLERIAVVFVQHAKKAMYPRDILDAQQFDVPMGWPTDPWSSSGQMLDWDVFFNQATGPVSMNTSDGTPDLEAWTSDFFNDSFNDWVGWSGQTHGDVEVAPFAEGH